MGNSNGRQSGHSSPRNASISTQNQPARTFDGGSLSPHGIYPGKPDYNPTHVLKHIRERRLAPFYKGLDDYEDEWTDYQLAFYVKERKIPPNPEPSSPVSPSSSNHQTPSNSSSPTLHLPPSVDDQGNSLAPNSPRTRGMSFVEPVQQVLDSPNTGASLISRDKRGARPRAQTTGSSSLIPTRGKPLEAVVYRGAIECPVCFLFYPPNINRTRCCWKPICTECFIEMKRGEPHYPTNDDPDVPNPSVQNLNLNPMNLVSDPVRCPFCVKTDFGVVYNPPAWLPTERRQDSPTREIATSPLHSDTDLPMDKREEMYPPGHERVVLSDNIRPDWYQALAHRRRVEARRLATATALQQALAVAGQRRRSGASRASGQIGARGLAGEPRRLGRRVDGIVRITRDEADEMMLQEAIRQSLQTQEEERQKREEEGQKKAVAEDATNAANTEEAPSTSSPRPSASTSSSPIMTATLPRLRPSTSTSPPSPRSFFSAFRTRSGSGSPPMTHPLTMSSRRPSSTTNLNPPPRTVRRQPSLPDSLLASTSASLATAMHDSIIPGVDCSRPSISSPLASHALPTSNIRVGSETTDVNEGSTPPNTSVRTSSTVDEEILPVSPVAVSQEPPALKTKDDAGNVEEREVVGLSH